jgi:hypothetical protein
MDIVLFNDSFFVHSTAARQYSQSVKKGNEEETAIQVVYTAGS